MVRLIEVIVMVVCLLVLKAFVAVGEQPPSVLLEKGIYLQETKGDLDSAIEVYEKVIQAAKDQEQYVAEAHYRLGTCHLKKGERDKAIEILRDVVTRYPDQKKTVELARKELDELRTPNEKANDATQEGWRLWTNQAYAEAEEKFEEALELDPLNTTAWNGLGWSQFNQGKSDAAKETFKKCLALDPEHPAALNGLGWIAKGDGQDEQAIEYWEKAVKSQPAAIAPLSGLADIYMDKGEYETALKYLREIAKYEPQNQDVKNKINKALEKLGQEAPKLDESAGAATMPEDLTGILDWEIRQIRERRESGHAYAEKGSFDLAWDRFKQGKDLSKEDIEGHIQEVRDYLAKHKSDEDYEWRIYELLARMSRDIGQPEKAIDYFEKALDAHPYFQYRLPSKFSKYQHIVNDLARTIRDVSGEQAAEDFIIDRLENDKKFEYFFDAYWALGKDSIPLMERVVGAYEVRLVKFPERKALTERYIQQTKETIQRLEKSEVEKLEGSEKRPTPVFVNKWFIAGSNRSGYEIGDEKVDGKNTSYLKSKESDTSGFGTIMRQIDPAPYKGKRIQMTAFIKTKKVQDWAGMWMRIDGPDNAMLGFDNMENRKIQGTTDLLEYSIVLDVPEEAVLLAYGLLISGSGQGWISEPDISIVGTDVETTNMTQ